MKKLENIKVILEKHKEELGKQYGIEEIGIFGSFLRARQKKDSDIDILVEFKPEAKMSFLEFVKLESYLSDLLGNKVDLVEKSALKPRIGKHILKEVEYLWTES